MTNETNLAGDADSVPIQWPANYAFRPKDGLAMLSSIVFLMAPLLAVMLALNHAFGIVDNPPMRTRLTDWQAFEFAAAFLVVGTPAALAGKYLWLICMCHVLDWASVGPLISYGLPRRISAFDRRLVLRLYREIGPAFEARLRPDVSAVRLFWYLPATFVVGAFLSFGAAYFHLVANEQRVRQNGLACALMGAAFGGAAYWLRRSNR